MSFAYTVSQVNQYVRNMFSQDYLLNRIAVEGEISNLKYHSSGHIYFSLKDSGGTLSCVMFLSQRKGLSFRLENGMQVVVTGTVSVYEAAGKYELYAKKIEHSGQGLLYEKFLKLKKELEEMGLFAPEYKKPIPRFAKRIGVVTASTGAAIRDIVNVSNRRNPYVQLILCPAQVQGDGAVQSIVNGIRRLSKENIDVMIVGRGGGSIEDLWAFNEEAVARAIFSCPIPVISAVGHETDTTISDMVSDLRAPTPSAAAELAVFSYTDFQESLSGYRLRLSKDMRGRMSIYREKAGYLEKQLLRHSPAMQLNNCRRDLAEMEDAMRRCMNERLRTVRKQNSEWKERMLAGLGNTLMQRRQRYMLLLERLKGDSPIHKLEQGYSYTEDETGHALRSIRQVKTGDTIQVHLLDGRILAEVRKELPNV